MKTLHKQEFLSFLKIISSALEKEEIKFDIPFVHINKTTFNHIYILVQDTISSFDITNMFNTQQVREKNGIIYSIIDDFAVNFVKTDQKLWGYTFYYYCWNVLPYFIDCLYKKFDCSYTRFNLKYIYSDKQIDISANLQYILEFIDLKLSNIDMGFYSHIDIYKYILNSIHYESNNMTIDNFKNSDPMFEYNKEYYEEFINNYRIDVSCESVDDAPMLIDNYFNSNLINKLSRIIIKEEFPNVIIKENNKIPMETNIKVDKVRKKIKLKHSTIDNMDFRMED